jgi:calcineurin-like phosphoesterase family protein
VKIFFTADTHYGHTNVIRHDTRPFKTIQEHDETLIDNWNKTVGATDEVWHLGDFAFRNELPIDYYTKKLNGRINFIRGNHDDKGAWKHPHLFVSMQEAAYIKRFGVSFYLLHYACRTWRSSHRGTYHLYGHSHGKLPPWGRSMDVGVNVCQYRPVSMEEVIEFLKSRPSIAHHESDGSPAV